MYSMIAFLIKIFFWGWFKPHHTNHFLYNIPNHTWQSRHWNYILIFYVCMYHSNLTLQYMYFSNFTLQDTYEFCRRNRPKRIVHSRTPQWALQVVVPWEGMLTNWSDGILQYIVYHACVHCYVTLYMLGHIQ